MSLKFPIKPKQKPMLTIKSVLTGAGLITLLATFTGGLFSATQQEKNAQRVRANTHSQILPLSNINVVKSGMTNTANPFHFRVQNTLTHVNNMPHSDMRLNALNAAVELAVEEGLSKGGKEKAKYYRAISDHLIRRAVDEYSKLPLMEQKQHDKTIINMFNQNDKLAGRITYNSKPRRRSIEWYDRAQLVRK